MYPHLPASPSGLSPRPPETYSCHPTSARTPNCLGAAINDVDNEARGEAAFDRISRGTRGTHNSGPRFRLAARAATKAANRLRTTRAQSRSGAFMKPSVRSGQGKEKSDASHGPETCCSINEKDDDSDIAEAKIMSLLSNDEPVNHAAKGHSHKTMGSDSASSSTAPHTALQSLLDTIDSNAKAVEEADPAKLATAGPELADIMRVWHNTMTRVIYATEAAERKRIQDVRAQLDYDRVVEDKHKKEMDTFSRQVRAQMLQMQQDHHQELKEQKQVYENLLAKQVAKPSAPTSQDRQPGTEPAQPRTVKSPSPHLQDKIDRLANEITTLKSENETKVSKMQASHKDQVLVLYRKVERLANANALLRIQEKPNKEKMQETERMKQTNEDLLQQIKDMTSENARLRQRVTPVPAFQFTAGGRGFFESTQSDPGPSSQEGGDSWSRKRARRQ